jgi:hypothetical protein
MSATMSGSVQLGLRVSKPDRSNLMLRRDLGLAPPAPGSKMSRTPVRGEPVDSRAGLEGGPAKAGPLGSPRLSSELTTPMDITTLLNPTSALAMRFIIDTHLIDDSSREMAELRELRRGGWIELFVSDVPATELRDAPIGRRDKLLEYAGDYSEYLGPLVVGHSRLDHSVLASKHDEERLHQVFSCLFPGRDWFSARRQDVRDAMNVATAIRNGMTGFITRDKQLLKAGPRIRQEFNDFPILDPSGALAFALRLRRRREIRTTHPSD